MQIDCEARMQRKAVRVVHPMELLDLSYRKERFKF